MFGWLRGKTLAAFAFLLIVTLVVGGLGWVTLAALRLERSDTLRLALWRLDGQVSPALAREYSRPYQHYDPVYAPYPIMDGKCTPQRAGSAFVPSPLLFDELPEWMALHFQTAPPNRWRSPQVLNAALASHFRGTVRDVKLTNVTPHRADLLAALARQITPTKIYACASSNDEKWAEQQAEQAPQQSVQVGQVLTGDNDFYNRAQTQVRVKGQSQKITAENSVSLNLPPNFDDFVNFDYGGKWTPDMIRPTPVTVGPMNAIWLREDDQSVRLVIARTAETNDRVVVQGVLLDWERLQGVLLEQIHDLFPTASVQPVFEENPSMKHRYMTALPVELDPGPLSVSLFSELTPLRKGLCLAWAAALCGLTVVGLSGWRLIDLSERRIRFVSAVTHELRTPLTTLRLYLDMLTGGLIRDPVKQGEYLTTLHHESDRLHRLISNVLDFAKLERQRPRLSPRETRIHEILDQTNGMWQDRCQAVGKQLVVCDETGGPVSVSTDTDLVQQILGILIDNACKYSHGAADGRVWLRAKKENGQVLFEVEDRGPGVAPCDRRGIFRPFRRGRKIDLSTGGVGLGLALAQRWAKSLGGRIRLCSGQGHQGACFQLALNHV